MMEKRSALGKGLSALIPDAPDPVVRAGVTELDIDLLAPNHQQPRLHIADVLCSSRTELEHQEFAAPGGIEGQILRCAGKAQGCVAHALIDFGIGDHAGPSADA